VKPFSGGPLYFIWMKNDENYALMKKSGLQEHVVMARG
jgi:hypothetical protein